MKLQVGRFGIELLSGEVQSVSDDGSKIEVSGVTAYAHKAEAETLRQQILGYVNSTDEAFVPVVWDEQPEFNGFYRVTGVSASGARAIAPQGVWSFSVTLERVTGFAAPLIELRQLGALRPDAPDTPFPLIVVPGQARSVGFFSESLETWIPFSPDVTREGAAGEVKVYNLAGYVTQFYVAPEHFYEGAATLMMGDDVAVTVGRQVRNQPDRWRLSNGLYEIESTGTDLFELQHRMWLDGDWSPWVSFGFLSTEGVFDRAPMPAPHSVVVLRNSPTEVAVRLLVTANGEYSPVTVDLSLKRGARSVSVDLRSVFTSRFAVQAASLTWTQADTWWVYADQGGVRHFIGSAYDVDEIDGDTVIPYEELVVSVKEWSFTLGAADAAGSGPEAAIQTIRSWLWAGSEKQAVVVQ